MLLVINLNIDKFFNEYSELAVALSGGADSALLLSLACEKAKRVKAYFVKSQFQPEFELEDARQIASGAGAELEVIYVNILADKTVASNPANRCYYCKKLIFKEIIEHARRDGFKYVADGTNATDDLSDRPGARALTELGVLSPLRTCGIGKPEVRRLAKERGIAVHNKPSYACLATRIMSGAAITAEALETTEKAENELFSLGFSDFRIRNRGDYALLQLSGRDMKLFFSKRAEATAALQKYYDNAFLDLKERSTDE